MKTPKSSTIREALQHIRYLSHTIGPRGSTRQSERIAHEYVENELAGSGLIVSRQSFLSPASAYQPYTVSLGVVLISWFALVLWGSQSARPVLVLLLFSFYSTILQLLLRESPITKLLPKKKSQNVWAAIQPRAKLKSTIVLAAHVDSHRTPLQFTNKTTYLAYRAITTLGMASFCGLLIYVFLLMRGEEPSILLHLSGLGLGVALLMTGHADLTSFSPGANDNASGVALLLSLAKRLKRSPLKQSQVLLLFPGCEEVGAYGMQAFIEKYANKYRKAWYIIIDSAGGKDGGPCYLTSEGLLWPVKYDPVLITICEQIARDRPKLGVYSYAQRGAFTDAIRVRQAGLPAIAIVGYTRAGWIPRWHRRDDTYENIDSKSFHRTFRFCLEFLRIMDKDAGTRA